MKTRACAWLIPLGMIGGTAHAQEPASPPSPPPPAATAQPPRRAATLPLSLVVDQFRLGNVTGTITESEVLSVDAGDLARLLDPYLTDAARERLRALGTDLVPVAQVAATGIAITLDVGTFALIVELSREARRSQTFAASGTAEVSGAEPVAPSNFAAGLTGALVLNTPLDSGLELDADIALAGFVNFGGPLGLNLDFGANIEGVGAGGTRFQRNRIVLFKDFPDRALRISAGDVVPLNPRLAGTSDIFGVTLTRDYAALQPARNIRPTLARSVTLDRRSIVEVFVNQALVERFQAGPGPIDITKIPLTGTSNDVVIIVEDALGRREVENLSFGSDLTLLDEGIDLFSASLGVLRDGVGGGFRYGDDPVFSGFYQRGLTPALTAGVHAVITEQLQNIGLGAGFATNFGVFTGEIAGSHEQLFGSGAAIGLAYRGSPFFGSDSDEIATVTFDYRTRDFATLGQFGFLDNLKFDLRADYQKSVTERVAVFANVSLTGRYGFEGNDRGVTLGVRNRLGVVTLNAGARYARFAGRGDDYGGFLSLSLPLGRNGNLSSSYDTAENRGRVEYRQRRNLDLPEIEYRVGATTSDNDRSLFGGVNFANTRFSSSADVISRLPRGGGRNATFGTARFQTGIGFADGKVAIGRDPSRGFAIVSRHPSIADSRLTVKTGAVGRELGFANDLGPALIPLNSPYRQQIITVDAANIPAGYDTGAGRYVLQPGARSGLHIQVGSDAYRTAIATLLYAGEPVSLASGRFASVSNPETSGSFFTNRAGRAVFDRLAPGRYTLVIDELRLTGEFTVSEAGDVLLRIGNLELKQQ